MKQSPRLLEWLYKRFSRKSFNRGHISRKEAPEDALSPFRYQITLPVFWLLHAVVKLE